MDASASNADVVYTGFWTDHSQNTIGKYRLTLTSNGAQILLAALTVLVTISAGRSWRLWAPIAHQSLQPSRNRSISPSGQSDQRQQQVVLRNSETAAGSLFTFLGLAIENKRLWVSARHLALILLSLLHWVLFIALGILTSQIARGRMVRSMETNHCGSWNAKDFPAADATLAQQQGFIATTNELALNASLQADDYARRCYDPASRNNAECNLLVKSYIPFTTTNTECVFSKEICAAENGTAIMLDTGKVSLADLGLNSRLSNKLFFQRQSVCSPIPYEPFLYTHEQAVATLRGGGNTVDSPDEIQAFAHVRLTSGKNSTTYFRSTLAASYSVYTSMALNGTFALPPLRPQRPSQQVSVVTLLGESVSYYTNFKDPLFNFNSRIVSNDSTGAEFVFWRIGNPINSVACQESVRYCSTHTDYCTPFDGVYAGGAQFEKLAGDHSNFTDVQAALVGARLAMTFSTLYAAMSYRGNSALQASRFVADSIQLRLNPGQWKAELEHWFKVSLAQIQMKQLNYVKMPGLDLSRVDNAWDETPILKSVCSIVKFNSPAHTTLSTLGVFIVIAFSILLAILSFWDSLFSRLIPQRVLGPWERDHALQLLKTPGQSQYVADTKYEHHSDVGNPQDIEGITSANMLSPPKSFSESNFPPWKPATNQYEPVATHVTRE